MAKAVDLGALTAYRSRVDAATGVREEFVDLTLDGVPTLGVVASPVGASRSTGWVSCHSFGIEQMNLDRVDVVVARALAAAGFPVLRFHAPGYGDSADRGRPADLGSHLRGSTDAAALFSERPGVERVGVMGARFGGMVAALVAERLGLGLLAMWQPHVRGSEFIRSSMQTAFLTEMLEQAQGATGGLVADLERQGWADVNGFALTREAYQDVSAVDLTNDVRTFAGSALVVGIARGGAMPSEPARVTAHLRALGATCAETVIVDKWAQMFGQHQYRSLPGGETEIDTQIDVSRALAETMVRWSTSQAGLG